jgi:CRP-like cAMP-binding protein
LENTIQKIESLGAGKRIVTRLIPLLHKEIFPKGHILIREGKVERSLFFLEKGVARAYLTNDGRDVTFWFGGEGDVLLSLKSYFSNEPGYESIELLENIKFHIPRCFPCMSRMSR